MIATNHLCALAGCDKPQFGVRSGGLGAWCYSHRYYQPVQHAPRACAECGEQYRPARVDQKFCSRRCQGRAGARRSYVPKPKLPPRRRQLTCAMCGIDYLAVWGRYCSRACTNKAWKQRERGDYLEGKRRHYRERVATNGAA